MGEPLRRIPLLDDVIVVAFLRASPLFGSLPEGPFGELVGAGELVDFAPRATVFAQGEQDDCLFAVFDGTVVIRKHHGDHDVDLAVLERGALFGEMGVLTLMPRSATALASTDTRLVRFPGTTVRAIADSVPKFGRLLAGLVAGRSRDTDSKLGRP